MVEKPVDLIVPWVDGNDPAWRMQRQDWSDQKETSESFYRDWQLMRYWFRGVERSLPWIHQIHFLTWGHLPPWLNTDHPKLNIVRHENFLPRSYRPTFSSTPIMLNIHRIPGLSEHFICANDDMYFLDRMAPSDYFQDGLPCDCPQLEPITEVDAKGFGHMLWNNIDVLNQHFDFQECLQQHQEKWFSSALPENVLQDNTWARKLTRFPGFHNPHLPIPMLKSTFEEVWRVAKDPLHHSSLHKFRSLEDCTEWLMRYWQFATGRFCPYVRKGGISLEIGAPENKLRDALLSGKNRVVCLNEGSLSINFDERKTYVKELFEILFPDMSSFERF